MIAVAEQLMNHYLLLLLLLAIMMVLFMLWLRIENRIRLSSRLNSLNHTDRKTTISLKDSTANYFYPAIDYAQRFKLFRNRENKSLSKTLSMAGFSGKISFFIYTLIQIITPTLFGIAAFWSLGELFMIDQDLSQEIIFIVASIVVGAYLPSLVLKFLMKRYRKKIHHSLPDVMDLMSMCLQAGYSNDETLKIIAHEFCHLAPQLAKEFYITKLELRLLPERKFAWANLVKRVPLDELKNLVASIEQNEKFGTSLLNNLKMLIVQLRKEQTLKAEDKAGKLPAILTLVMVFFIFPITIILLLTPAIVKVYSGG